MSSIKNNRCYTKIPDKAYPVGAWIPPLPEIVTTQEEVNLRYKEAKEVGINVINATFEYATPGALERCLNAAALNGQRVMVGMPYENPDFCLELVEKTRDNPVVIGYTMKDEPLAPLYPQLGELRDRIRKVARENQFVMCNMLPNYSTTWDEDPAPETGLTSYQKYLKDYMDIVRPDCLSLDHYPFALDSANDSVHLKCMLRGLTDIRNIGEEYGVETWGFIQDSGWKGMRQPNEKELRFVINMHLAFGFKELSYFLYWEPWAPGKCWDGTDYTGMISYEGEKTPLYHQVQKVGKDWQAMDNAYLEYDCKAFIIVNIEEEIASGLQEAKVVSSYGPVSSVSSFGKIFIGCMEDGEDTTSCGHGYFVVNFDYASEEGSKVEIALNSSRNAKVWGKAGLEQDGLYDGVSVMLGPGEAKFIEVQ